MIKQHSVLFILTVLFVCPALVAQQILFTSTLKNNETVRIAKLDVHDKEIFAQAKDVFIKAFENAYKNFTPEQLYLTPKPGFLPSFLQAAFEDEENDFNGQKDGSLFVVAHNSHNKVIGFVAFDKDVHNNESKIYIRQLAIDPAYKNQGLGKLLCIDTVKEINEHKPARVVVCTRKINEPAIQFYHKLNFKDASMDEVHPELPDYKYRGFVLTMN